MTPTAPDSEKLIELAEKVERTRMVHYVPSGLYIEIKRERRLQILCRAMCERDGFNPDEVTDPATLRLRWRDYEGYVRIVDSHYFPPHPDPDEVAAAIRLRAMVAQQGGSQ